MSLHKHVKPLWTATDVAAYLRVSRSWVYDRASAGELPHVRFGGNLRFDPEKIVAYAQGAEPEAINVVKLRG